ncbi:uncharacterized protein LOC125362439 [Perognathus longimembris pacificus]|uniref:uncharacterized protein LOC125362439 n=1 Tax=Perognathus longimembris pacificus TaxID=214514 RepID=UPI00201851EB|nr:uncharacterized protein LOC125362439 [Perognathus longimembris pacificus]
MSLLYWVAGWTARPKLEEARLQECAPETSARDRDFTGAPRQQCGGGPEPSQFAARTASGHRETESLRPPRRSHTERSSPERPILLTAQPLQPHGRLIFSPHIGPTAISVQPRQLLHKPLSFSAQPFKGERRRLLPRERRDWGGPRGGRQHRPQPWTGPASRTQRPGCRAPGKQRDPAGSREVDLHDLRLQLRQPRRALQSSAGQTHNYNNPPPSLGVTRALPPPECPTHSYLQLQHVFSQSGFWGGGARKPEARHADLSPPPERGTTLGEGDASWGSARPPASGWRPGPFLYLHSRSASARRSALLPLLPRPSRAKYGNPPRPGSRGSRQPAPSQGCALSALVPPPVLLQPHSPSSEKVTPELPGRARVGGAGGRRWGPA